MNVCKHKPNRQINHHSENLKHQSSNKHQDLIGSQSFVTKFKLEYRNKGIDKNWRRAYNQNQNRKKEKSLK